MRCPQKGQRTLKFSVLFHTSCLARLYVLHPIGVLSNGNEFVIQFFRQAAELSRRSQLLCFYIFPFEYFSFTFFQISVYKDVQMCYNKLATQTEYTTFGGICSWQSYTFFCHTIPVFKIAKMQASLLDGNGKTLTYVTKYPDTIFQFV